MSSPPVSLPEPAGAGGGMLCPRCAVVLVMTERQGVEIDYCPKCRGIWLDRGEIEKIIERSVEREMPRGEPGPARYPDERPPQAYPPAQGWSDRGHGGGHHGGYGGHGGGHHGGYGGHGSDPRGYGKHGRRSWLRDLFD